MLGHRVRSEISYLPIKLHGVAFHKIVPLIKYASNWIYFEICIYIALLHYKFSYYGKLVCKFFFLNYRPACDKNVYNSDAYGTLYVELLSDVFPF